MEFVGGFGRYILVLILSLSLCLHPSAGIIETLLLAAKLREEERTISGSTKAGRALGKLLGEHLFFVAGSARCFTERANA